MNSSCRAFFLILLHLFLVALPLGAADWPQYRGPQRDGISPETSLLQTWPEEGPPKLWQAEIGVGGGSCAIVGNQVYVMGGVPQKDSDERKPPIQDSLICLSAQDGRTLWVTPVEEFTREKNYHSPHATPTVTGGKVYGTTRTGRLFCCDAQTGQLLWNIETVPMMGDADHSHYGYSCSPLVEDGRVIIFSRYGENGLPPELRQTLLTEDERSRLQDMDPAKRERFFWRVRGSALAFSAETGELLWRSAPLPGSTRNDLGSPITGDFHGRRLLLYPTGQTFAALAPETGDLVWKWDLKEGFGLDDLGPVHTGVIPVINGNLVVHRLWNHKETNRTYALRVTPEGAELAWTTPYMSSWYHSYVAPDGLLIGLDNQGIKGSVGPACPGTRPPEIGMLQCYRLETGKLLWHTDEFDPHQAKTQVARNRPGYIYADGKLILQTPESVVLLAVDEKGADIVGTIRSEDGSTSYAPPSLANGRLYIRRSNGNLHCYDLRTAAATRG